MTALNHRPASGRCILARCSTLALVFSSSLLTGCQTFQPTSWLPGFGGDALARARSGIDDVVGPLQRRALSQSRSRNDAAARAELEDAHRLYEANDYAAAERAYAKIADRRDPRKFKLLDDDDGGLFTLGTKDEKRLAYDPVREEAVFYVAECRFLQGRYPKANDTYKALMKDYPSSRYLDESSGRLFEIAKIWLGVDDFVTSGEIRTVSFDEESRESPLSNVEPPKKRFLPNFTDKTRPVFDTHGQALQALRAIWINDPSGHLADDAIMLAATHHLRSENYRESARLMKLIREQFPRSEHLQNAFVVGSHVELMSYQGASYDEQRLDEAYELKENALRLFPDAPGSDRMRNELKLLYNARAEREWKLAQFYEKKNKPAAVEIYCRELLRLYPNSDYAPLARQKLAALGGSQIPQSDAQEPEEPIQPFQSVPDVPEGPVFESGGPIYDGA